MPWKLVVAVLLSGAAILACVRWWNAESTRTSTVVFSNPEIHLTYSVAWGSGMHETLVIRNGTALHQSPKVGGSPEKSHTRSSAIIDKPYHSGALVYRTQDGGHYDIKLGARMSWDAFRYAPSSHTVTLLDLCGLIAGAKNSPSLGQPSEKLLGAHVSHYFPGRIYMGQFRIFFRTPYDRGEGVEFIPAGVEKEPPLDNGECP